MTPTNPATSARRRRGGNRERFVRQVMFLGLSVSIIVLSISIVVLKRRQSADRHRETNLSAQSSPASLEVGHGVSAGRNSRAGASAPDTVGRRAAAATGAGPVFTAEEERYAKLYARTRFVPPPPSDAAVGADGVENDDEEDRPMFHRLPNVLLVGAQKAGTTSIANFLFGAGACGGAVIGDEPAYYAKEVQFFNDEDRYSRGLPFYAERYANCAEDAITLDATPNYLTYVRRIRAAYDDAGGGQADRLKIIAILREPISRELSWYNHLVYQLRKTDPPEYAFMVARDLDKPGGPGAQVITFGQYVNEQTLALLLGPARRYDTATPPCHQDKYSEFPPCFGLYAHFLEEWFDWFDRDRVLVLSYDELEKDPDTLKGRLIDFLDLDKEKAKNAQFSKNANKHATSFKVTKPGCAMTEKLKATFASPNDALYELLQQRPGPPMEQRPFPKFSDAECEG